MPRISRRVRRLLGVVLLAAAGLMLVLGSTLFRSQLQGATFAVYWLACFALVFLTLVVALWDIISLRHEVRDEQIRLMKDVFGQSPGSDADQQETKR